MGQRLGLPRLAHNTLGQTSAPHTVQRTSLCRCQLGFFAILVVAH
jgi:hypothetical protein